MISAGQPIAAFGQQDDPYAGETLTLTVDLVPDPREVYTLQVKGDSMIDALVNDGDWVVIKHQNTAKPHDMIVAWIRDREETTLKYYYPGRRARPAPTCEPEVRADLRAPPINSKSRARSSPSSASCPE